MLHNCQIYAEGLNQSHEGSLVVGSVSMSPYMSLVDSVGCHVVSLKSLTPTILLPIARFPKLGLIFGYGSLKLFPVISFSIGLLGLRERKLS